MLKNDKAIIRELAKKYTDIFIEVQKQSLVETARVMRAGIDSIDSLPAHIFDEIMHFFTVYKELENKTTAVNEIDHADVAKRIIAEDIESLCTRTFRIDNAEVTVEKGAS